MKIQVGVTSTRRGMTSKQQARGFSILHNLKTYIDEARHGDCIGGDEQFHAFFRMLGFRTIIHPPSDPRFRAYCKGAWRVEKEDDYLKRDRAIVRASTLIISAPYSETPQLRSGTWYTDKYTLKSKRDLIRVLPDGSVVPIRYTVSLFSPLWDMFERMGVDA